MRIRIWTIALALVSLFALALLATSFFFDGKETGYKEELTSMESGACIEGTAGPTSFGAFVGDRIEFEVSVLFCDEIEVDEKRLARQVNLAPFEQVGEVNISRKTLENGLQKIEARYTILGIEVFPGRVYHFPAILVEYSHKGGNEQEVYRIENVSPIYISRLTPFEFLGAKEDSFIFVEFRPLKPEIFSRGTLIPREALIGLGALFFFLAGAEFVRIVRPKRQKPHEDASSYQDEVRTIEQDILLEVERSPRVALHRLYYLAREVLGAGDTIERIAEVAYANEEPQRELAKELAEEFSKAAEKKFASASKEGGGLS